jgi:FkbM family methyltransferase
MSALRANWIEALRGLGARPGLHTFFFAYMGAPTVRPRTVFAVREILGRTGVLRKPVFLYRLRENGLRVAIRHGSGDALILGEVFNRRYVIYQPTDEVEQALGQVRSIVDLGGNIALFGLFAAARWPQAQIVAFEPDPDNAAVHELTIAANGLTERCQLIKAAASNRDGRASFVAGLAHDSHIADATDSEQTIEVPVIDVLARIAQADLLKIDIEGGEWAILGDPRFREAPPRAVILEYHPHLCPGADPRAEAESALRAAGLCVQSIAEDGDIGMFWAWRTY